MINYADLAKQFGGTTQATTTNYADIAAKYGGVTQQAGSFPTSEPEQVKSSFFTRLTSPGFFQSQSDDSAFTAAAKTAGNVFPSAGGFVKGVVNFLNPKNSAKAIAETGTDIGNTISGYVDESRAEVQGYQNETAGIEALVAQISKNKAAGKDTSHSEKVLEKLISENQGRKASGDQVELAKGTAKGAYETLVPQFFQQLFSGDTEGAQKTIVEDPSGQLLPVVLTLKEVVKGTQYEKPFNETISKTAQTVTKPVEAAITKTKNVASTFTRYGTSQATGLSPKTIQTIIENPEQFTTENAATYTREAIGQKVHSSLTNRIDELHSTGKGYDAIRQQPGHVVLGDNIAAKVFDKYGLKLDAEGHIIQTAESIPLKSGDLAALEQFYKQYGKEKVLSNNGFLNTRKALDHLSEWDAAKSDISNKIARELRSAYDKAGKEQVTGLAELDARYSSELTALKKVRKDYLNPDGTFKDNAVSKIANLSNKGRETVLARLEQIQPGIGKEIQILKAIEDIEAASGQKVGTYARATLSGGGFVGGIITGNPLLIGASVLEAVLSEPHNATAILRGYARLKGLSDSLSAPIIDTLKDINNFDVQKLQQKMQNQPVGLSITSPKRIPADDLNVMSDFTDYVAKSYKPSAKQAKALELDASRLAEKYGIKIGKTNKSIANAFARILEENGFKRPDPNAFTKTKL